ncbi:MAG TPA: quinone-dependent dihydroorotate dehydrogenase [Patescibacteria group bacterium]
MEKYVLIKLCSTGYRYICKPLFFLFNPQFIHTQMTLFGEILGESTFVKRVINYTFNCKSPMLSQKIQEIDFLKPVGLAAGFDYEAKLTNILYTLGFGFQSIGTITNNAYKGNTPPMLGRLPKSKSLMVNKGFKNMGVKKITQKLKNKIFTIPLGISIGRTNSPKLNLQESIEDIISAFKTIEKNKIKNAYYELNISCPNLYGNVDFYNPKNLDKLLFKIDSLKIKKPIFIKMPISKTNEEIEAMLSIIVKHCPKGVIIGNLQSKRDTTALVQEEVKQFPIGSFSGKPCEERSNQLIELAYKHYGKQLTIVGCGGIFSAQDAYKKIKLGASVVQLITGMIFQGPQLIAEINSELINLLKKDGFSNISQAIGNDVK